MITVGSRHFEQATALVAFHNLDLIRQNLRLTEPVDNGIATCASILFCSILRCVSVVDRCVMSVFRPDTYRCPQTTCIGSFRLLTSTNTRAISQSAISCPTSSLIVMTTDLT